MATMYMNPTETNSLYPKNDISSLKSFWAFLLSLLLYISVFYAFDLSASTLLCTTKFWFFISNTLIFIIAADFGAFSSSKEADFYQEYSNPVRPTHPFHPKHVEIATADHDHERHDYDKPREKIINIICCSTSTTKNDCRIENHEPDVEEKHAHYAENLTQIIPQVENEARALKKRSKAVSFRRNSAEEIISKIDDDKLVVKRTLSAGHKETPLPPPRGEENDEYSRMSDEELNRRVEDFIRKFNRQIRQQACKSPQI